MQSEALILESHYSTHIEGTKLTLAQSKKILTGKTVTGINKDDRQELLNYKEAMDFVSEYLGKKSDITENLALLLFIKMAMVLRNFFHYLNIMINIEQDIMKLFNPLEKMRCI